MSIPAVAIAKLFWSGRSQAVRLPKEFRLDASEVRVRREGRALILEPVEDELAWLDRISGPWDADFLAAVEEEMPMQERPELNDMP